MHQFKYEISDVTSTVEEPKQRVYDLEERLVEFAVVIIEIAENLPNTRSGNHLSGHIIRSGTLPALNYGEAQAAESRNDFDHKMKVCLKELCETSICLKIIDKIAVYSNKDFLKTVRAESQELIAIFQKSIQTSKANLNLQTTL